MDSVLSNLQKHFTVGPLDFHCNNDLRATELQATSADYALMGEDEQLIALAAARAQIAMHIEENNRRSGYGSRSYSGGGRSQERLRDLASGGRERVQEVIATVRDRAPELLEKARHIREQAPLVIQSKARHIREQAPLVIHGIKEFVLELGKDPLEQPTYDCDAAGRQISVETDYNNSLNEEEEREAPPISPHSSRNFHAVARHAIQSYQPSKHDDAEVCRYVNIEDGGGGGINSVIKRSTGGEPVNTGYTDMSDDPLDVKRHSPPIKRQPADQIASKQEEDSRGALQWGPNTGGKEEIVSAQSTAKCRWGAASSAAEQRALARKLSKADATVEANEDDDTQVTENAMTDKMDRSADDNDNQNELFSKDGMDENVEVDDAETLLDSQIVTDKPTAHEEHLPAVVTETPAGATAETSATAFSELHEDFDT